MPKDKGVAYGFIDDLSIGFLEIPVVEDRNGIQHESDLRMVFGLSKGF